MRKSILLALVLLAAPASARAQTTVSMLDRFLVGVSAQLQLPFLDDDVNAQLLDLGARIYLGSHTNLMAEIPIIRATANGPLGGDLEAVRVANPYVGLRLFSEHHLVDVGVRIPLVDSDDFEDGLASIAGALSDWDRTEAWLGDYLPLRVQYTGFLGQPRLADGLSTRLVIGPTLLIGQDGADTELLANYGLALSHASPRREIQAAFTGVAFLTEDDDLSERTQHHLSLGITLRTTGVRPSAFIRIPLDAPVSDVLNFVLGMGIVADLR